MQITLPYPPSVNHYKSIGRTVHTSSGKSYQIRVNAPKTKKYFHEVFVIVKNLQLERLHGDIVMNIEVYPPDYRKRDLDNICKVLLDSLELAGVYNDDNQIVKLTLERKEMRKGGEIRIEVKKL